MATSPRLEILGSGTERNNHDSRNPL